MPYTSKKVSLPEGFVDLGEEMKPMTAIEIEREPASVHYPSLYFSNAKELMDFPKEGTALKTAWAVARVESNGRPLALNDNTRTGDKSYGIFQINMLGQLGEDRKDKFELVSNKELLDEIANTKVKEQATEAVVEAIIKEVKKDIKKEAEVVYPKPNHFPDCNCFKCLRWKQNA